MSQSFRKSKNFIYKVKAVDKMPPKTKRSKKGRPATETTESTTTTATPAKYARKSSVACSDPVDIKTERNEDDEVAEVIDVKPDISALNEELFGEGSPAAALPTQPTLYIIRQLPSSCLVNANAAAAALTPTSPGGASLRRGFAPIAATEGVASGAKVDPTKFFDNVDEFEFRDEVGFQESDSDEDGYTDIESNDEDDFIEADDEDEAYAPQWTEQPTAPRMVCSFGTLPANVGLYGRPSTLEPNYYIEKMLLNRREFFQKIADGTNAKAKIQMRANRGRQIYLKDISDEEMRVFVGICLQMSTMKLRTLSDYWNRRAVWGFEGFARKMSLSRFQMIMSALSFDHLLIASSFKNADGSTENWTPTSGSGDRGHADPAFGNVQPLVDFFNARMSAIYNDGQRLVLNDPIIMWKGRFSLFSELSPRFRCNALLLHLLTDYSGLIYRLVLDVERSERRANVRNSELLIEQRLGVAMHLLNTRLGKGHTIYASKFYGSYALAHKLAAQQTYCTGLVDVKRFGNCKELILNPLPPKAFAIKYAGSIMMGKWRNRQKSIYFYSSDCLAIYSKETSMRTPDKRPKIIKELCWQLNWKLSEEMKAKMVCYQLCLERKELKWDKQLAVYLLNLLLFNAYVLYVMHAQVGRTRFTELHLRDMTTLKSYADFRQEFIQSLLGDDTAAYEQPEAKKKKKRTTSVEAGEEAAKDEKPQQQTPEEKAATEQSTSLEAEHLPMLIPRRKGKVMKKKCRICHKRGLLSFSKLCCEACPGMPGLCETPCFAVWHDHLKRSLEAGVKTKKRVLGSAAAETIYF